MAGKEQEYTDFLVRHIQDSQVLGAAMHGGQQYLDRHNNKNPDFAPMGLAQYIMLDD